MIMGRGAESTVREKSKTTDTALFAHEVCFSFPSWNCHEGTLVEVAGRYTVASGGT